MDVAFVAVRNVSIALAGGLWVASLLWVVADARARLVRPRRIHLTTAAAALLPFVGVLGWVVVRPPETLEERRERKLRRRAFERAVREGACANCGTEVEDDFLCCPRCGLKVRNQCGECGKLVELTWRACPHCGGRVERTEPAAFAEAARSA